MFAQLWRQLEKFGLGRAAAYAGFLALAAFALSWLEYRRAARMFPAEAYVIIVAVLFVLLGIWMGRQLTVPKDREGFSRNEAAIEVLGLSSRECAVLELLGQGMANKEIARALEISPNTVKTHLSHLFEKLDVSRRAQAVMKAKELSLIP
ncbi:helix-turn-helix transcriptional regulator [Parvularcula mediterranea]